MAPSEIAYRARELIDRGWCQGVDAQDGRGLQVDPWSPRARSWSLLGALVGAEGVGIAVGRLPVTELGRAIVALGEVANTHSLQAWNDDSTRTKTEVLAVLDAALAALRADETTHPDGSATSRSAGNQVPSSRL